MIDEAALTPQERKELEAIIAAKTANLAQWEARLGYGDTPKPAPSPAPAAPVYKFAWDAMSFADAMKARENGGYDDWWKWSQAHPGAWEAKRAGKLV